MVQPRVAFGARLAQGVVTRREAAVHRKFRASGPIRALREPFPN